MTADRFLSRWMRRKAAARRTEAAQPAPPAPVKAADAVAPAVPGASPPPAAEVPLQAELPTLDSLQGLASEYRGFMNVDVDPNVQRAALKKLFSDPHFNIMDGLDVYIDDYGIPDPIPADMLANLRQAQSLLFNEPEIESADAPEAEPALQPTAIAATDDTTELQPPAPQVESAPVVAGMKEAPDSTAPANEPPVAG